VIRQAAQLLILVVLLASGVLLVQSCLRADSVEETAVWSWNRSRSLEGRVTFCGQPVRGGEVRLLDVQGHSLSAITVTDRDGRFSLQRIPVQSLILEFRPTGGGAPPDCPVEATTLRRTIGPDTHFLEVDLARQS